MSKLPRSHELLSHEESRLLVIDMQQKLVPIVQQPSEITSNCLKLIEAAKLLNIPIAATEQYPKGLGPTIDQLAEHLPAPIEKIDFSCANTLNWGLAQDDPQSRFKVVIAGIETHVCVLQTVFDLMAVGYRVYVAVDAISSRKRLDQEIALQRMAAGGATLTTTESVIFEWSERAGTPEFKQLSRLVVGRPAV